MLYSFDINKTGSNMTNISAMTERPRNAYFTSIHKIVKTAFFELLATGGLQGSVLSSSHWKALISDN